MTKTISTFLGCLITLISAIVIALDCLQMLTLDTHTQNTVYFFLLVGVVILIGVSLNPLSDPTLKDGEGK